MLIWVAYHNSPVTIAEELTQVPDSVEPGAVDNSAQEHFTAFL